MMAAPSETCVPSASHGGEPIRQEMMRIVHGVEATHPRMDGPFCLGNR
jgi:hypothetical protein